MRKLLNSSTSLTLCMALVAPAMVPTFAAAQDAQVGVCGAAAEQETFPCTVGEGTVIETKEDLLTFISSQNAPDAVPLEEAQTAEEAPTEAAPVEEAPEAGVPAEEAPAGEAATEATPAEEVAEEQPAAPVEQEAQEQSSEAAPVTEESVAEETEAAPEAEQADAPEAEAPEAQEAAPEATAPATNEAAPEAEAEAPQAQERTSDTSAAEQEAADEKALEKALQQEKDADAAQAQPEPVEAEKQAEPAAEAPAESVTEAVEDTKPQARPEAEATPEPQPLDAEAEAARQEARIAESEAEREAARKALEEEPAGEVITEEVTTEDTRRSDEDFATKATGTAEKKKDDGLSKLEKALILGLGAAAVGAVLKNGDKVLSNSGDRIVVQDENGGLRVLKDDDTLLRRPGDEVQTERFNDGSTRQIVQKPDGSKITTIRSSSGTVLRRISTDVNGNETILVDDLADERRVVVRDLPRVVEQSSAALDRSEAELRAALVAEQNAQVSRGFSLRQVREIGEVRALAPQIELDAVRFATGSAAIAPEQARSLSRVGNTMRKLIADDPRTVFLIEGHTDAVGNATYNLALSDRRAETVALALTEYFDVPPANMITQGYGESALKVQTLAAEQANRRAVVRNITNLLRQASN